MFSNFFAGPGDKKVKAFKASDNLFNSIAKGSTNSFPELRGAGSKYMGHKVDLHLNLPNEALADRSEVLLQTAGATAEDEGTNILLMGGLGQIMPLALRDSEALFNNQGQ